MFHCVLHQARVLPCPSERTQERLHFFSKRYLQLSPGSWWLGPLEMVSSGLLSRNHIVLCGHKMYVGLRPSAELFSDLCLFTEANSGSCRQGAEVTAKSTPSKSLWPAVFMGLACDKIQGLHSNFPSRKVAIRGVLNLNMGVIYGW